MTPDRCIERTPGSDRRTTLMDLVRNFGYLGLATRLKRLGERLQAEVSSIYSEQGFDVRAHWFVVLRALEQGEAAGVAELADELQLALPTVAQMVRALEARGLVRSATEQGGRRRRLVVLTDRGGQVQERLGPLWGKIERATAELVAESGGDLLASLAEMEASLARKPLRERLEPPSAFEIVDFRAEYAEAFRTLNLAWLEAEFSLEPADREVLDHPAEAIIAAGGEILFALQGERVVGTCAVLFHDLPDATIGELTKMAIAPNFRRRGVGRALARAAIALCARRGIDSVFLFTSVRLAGAVAFYESLGFGHTEEAPIPHPGYSRPSIVMRCRLGL